MNAKASVGIISALMLLVLATSFVTSRGSNAILATRRTTVASQPIPLPPPHTVGGVSVEEALAIRRSVREYRESKLSLEAAGQLLWAAQGITDPSRGLRTAPSAGALYPLEIRLLSGGIAGLDAGLYHYDPNSHSLLPELKGDLRASLSEAALGQGSIRRAPCILLISGVVSRTAVKYGSRAERYVLMEAGHSAQNVYLQAASMALGTVSIGAFQDDRAKEVLQISDEERLIYIMPVGKLSGGVHE